jgi:hypothetical protein
MALALLRPPQAHRRSTLQVLDIQAPPLLMHCIFLRPLLEAQYLDYGSHFLFNLFERAT